MQRSAEYHLQVFREAPEHSLEGAIWKTLVDHGLAEGAIDRAHPVLTEFVTLKEELHGDLMRQEAIEVPGATRFVRLLAEHGFAGKMAIASTAYRRDIFICLEKLAISDLFPPERIISKDMFTHAKPHPEPFLLALQSLRLPAKVRPGQVLAFEDDPRGVASAKAAGLFTCAVPSRYSADELQALDVPPDLIGTYAELEQKLGLS